MKNFGKKGQGQLEGVSRIAIALVPLVIGLVVAFLLIAEGSDQAENLISSTGIVNESVVSSAGAAVQLVSPNRVPGSTSCDSVRNLSVGISTDNFTCGDAGFTLNEANFGTTCCNVSYTFKGRDLAWNSTATLKESLDIVPDFSSIIVIALIGSVLISLVLVFRNR